MYVWSKSQIDFRKLWNLIIGNYSIEIYFLSQNRAFAIEFWIIITNKESKETYSPNLLVTHYPIPELVQFFPVFHNSCWHIWRPKYAHSEDPMCQYWTNTRLKYPKIQVLQLCYICSANSHKHFSENAPGYYPFSLQK